MFSIHMDDKQTMAFVPLVWTVVNNAAFSIKGAMSKK